jgi:hypothetical protein
MVWLNSIVRVFFSAIWFSWLLVGVFGGWFGDDHGGVGASCTIFAKDFLSGTWFQPFWVGL